MLAALKVGDIAMAKNLIKAGVDIKDNKSVRIR